MGPHTQLAFCQGQWRSGNWRKLYIYAICDCHPIAVACIITGSNMWKILNKSINPSVIDGYLMTSSKIYLQIHFLGEIIKCFYCLSHYYLQPTIYTWVFILLLATKCTSNIQTLDRWLRPMLFSLQSIFTNIFLLLLQ